MINEASEITTSKLLIIRYSIQTNILHARIQRILIGELYLMLKRGKTPHHHSDRACGLKMDWDIFRDRNFI